MTNDGRYRSAKRNTRMARLETAHGVTLVELLVVIGIMVAVMAIAIPVVRLTSNDNRVALATQAVRSFLMEAIAAADRQGNSYVIFERNTNNPDYCYRLYRGRPRPAYRGEGETAYAIKAFNEEVVLPGVPAGAPPSFPGVMQFEVFYLFNTDASKLQPYQYLSFRDRPERYLIFQSYNMELPPGQFWPVAKVYCRLDPQIPLSNVSGSRASYTSIQPEPPFVPWPTPHTGWSDPNVISWPRNAGNQLILFGPPEQRGGSNSDIPNYVGNPATGFVMTSRLRQFEVSQTPMVDELNYLDLPQGMAIFLGASGFIDNDEPNSRELTQVGFMGDLGVRIRDEFGGPDLGNLIHRELNDPSFENYIGNDQNSSRAEYYPWIELEGSGRISRVFVMSPTYTAAASRILRVGPNLPRIQRSGPLYPLFPLYLLVGEDNVAQRLALLQANHVPSITGDHWVTLGAQNSTAKVVKAQPTQINPPIQPLVQLQRDLLREHVRVAESVSER